MKKLNSLITKKRNKRSQNIKKKWKDYGNKGQLFIENKRINNFKKN